MRNKGGGKGQRRRQERDCPGMIKAKALITKKELLKREAGEGPSGLRTHHGASLQAGGNKEGKKEGKKEEDGRRKKGKRKEERRRRGRGRKGGEGEMCNGLNM